MTDGAFLTNFLSRHCSLCDTYYGFGEQLTHQRNCVLSSVVVVYQAAGCGTTERMLVREVTGERCPVCGFEDKNTAKVKQHGLSCLPDASGTQIEDERGLVNSMPIIEYCELTRHVKGPSDSRCRNIRGYGDKPEPKRRLCGRGQPGDPPCDFSNRGIT